MDRIKEIWMDFYEHPQCSYVINYHLAAEFFKGNVFFLQVGMPGNVERCRMYDGYGNYGDANLVNVNNLGQFEFVR